MYNSIEELKASEDGSNDGIGTKVTKHRHEEIQRWKRWLSRDARGPAP